MRSLKVMAGLLALLLVAGACGYGETTTTTTTTEEPTVTPDFEVAVALSEWAVGAEASVGRGEVRFNVTNGGGTVHQLAVYRGGSLSGDSIDGGELIGRTGNIRADGTDALQVSLDPGSYWLVCPISGHTAAGLSTEITVGS